jgi:hypothetical protein
MVVPTKTDPLERAMRRVAVAVLSLLMFHSFPLCSQSTKPPAKPDCSDEVRQAQLKLSDLFTLDLGDSEKIPLALLVEDLGPTKIPLEMAARESLNLFPDRFVIQEG